MGKPLINDNAGGSWQLSANPNGSISLVFNVAAPVSPLLIAEYRSPNAAPAAIYELKFVPGMGLALFFSSGTDVPQGISIDTSTNPNVFLLQVVQGNLQLLVANLGADLAVGQLMPNDGSYPIAVQGGGLGTPVTNILQTQGEMLGLWVAGCGHWFNNYDVRFAEVGGVPSALVCCPLCLFIQRIISPASEVYSEANAIIFA